jgi:hypothetical protein
MTNFNIGDIVTVKNRPGHYHINKIAGDRVQLLTCANQLVVAKLSALTFFKSSNFKGI